MASKPRKQDSHAERRGFLTSYGLDDAQAVRYLFDFWDHRKLPQCKKCEAAAGCVDRFRRPSQRLRLQSCDDPHSDFLSKVNPPYY